MSTFTVTDKTLPLLLTRRAEMIGLPNSITAPVIKDFCRWHRCSGPDWAVARMKVIKQIILNYAAGIYDIPKDAWVRHKGPILKGTYGQLQMRANCSNRQLRKVLTFLNLYTALSRRETTEKVVQKFRQTVETEGPSFDEGFHALIQLKAAEVGKRYGSSKPVQYAPPYEQSAYQKDHQEAEFLEVVERSFRTPMGIKLISTYPCVYMPMLNVMGFRGYRFADEPEVMGRVFRIPSPGLKDRWVCDFNKAFDYCLKPMGKWIYDLVAKLPWDITYDESKCYRSIQQALRRGQKVYSFDLSSATDRFPWSLQLTMLKSINKDEKFQEMVELYDFLIHQPALMPDGTQVRWVQGQPLGAYPSFATFTCTHGLLLLGLLDGDYQQQFFVHGDDLVVLDDKLAYGYKNAMDMLGVPISRFKTLQSTKIAEINSKIITADHILTIPKWKPITRHNALGQMKTWGLSVIKFLKLDADEEWALKKLASLPVCLGGSGVNPDGLPLEKRMEGLEDILFKEKELSYEGSTRTKVLKRYLHSPNFRNLLDNALRDAERTDQVRLKSMPIKVYGDYRDLDILGKNDYSVNPDKPIAIEGGSPRDRSKDEVQSTVRKLKKSSAFSRLKEEDG